MAEVEIAATAIMLVSVGGIIRIYLFILKKNGWIGKLKKRDGPVNSEKTIINVDRFATKKIEHSVIKEQAIIGDKKHRTVAKTELNEVKPDSNVCSHFFGYLRSIEKNTDRPDECYFCLKLIDCSRKQNL